MPITDPKFQHSDEDWTQITQPRLRKRVQNRVSQRKHRKGILKLLAPLDSSDGRQACQSRTSAANGTNREQDTPTARGFC